MKELKKALREWIWKIKYYNNQKKKVASGLEEIPSDRFVWKDLVIFFSFLFFHLWLPEKILVLYRP